jgi:hypothetical protein
MIKVSIFKRFLLFYLHVSESLHKGDVRFISMCLVVLCRRIHAPTEAISEPLISYLSENSKIHIKILCYAVSLGIMVN